MVPPTAALAGLGYMSYLAFCPEGRPKPTGRCNFAHKLNEAKVVDAVDIEDIAEKAAFCRCWKSKNVNANIKFIKHFALKFTFLFSGLIVMVLMERTTKLQETMSVHWLSNIKLKARVLSY